MIQHPPFLSQNDVILVISPSGVVNKEAVLQGIDILKEAGYSVEIAPHVFQAHFKFGATHQQRLADLQYALDHTEAKAIYCARGGFGITHIVDRLDWTEFKKNPKWIVGFSDITALLHAAYQNGYCALHASVLQGLSMISDSNTKSIFDSLKGEFVNLKAQSECNKSGSVKAALIGGNVSLLVHQIGSQTELDYSGKILFIEEVAEPLYHIDRMLLQLKRAGKLENLAGLAVGQFTKLSEEKSMYGQSVQEIILAHCEDYNFPIGFNLPFGHGQENMALVHGNTVTLRVIGNAAKLKY